MVYELIDEMFQQLLEQDHGVLGVLRRDRGGCLDVAFNLYASRRYLVNRQNPARLVPS